MIGMPSGVDNAVCWKLSYMLAQEVALLGDGAEPPPLSTEPIRKVARSDWGCSAPRSAWVIWPIFSSSDEHTSELQSRGHLVCRLVLEKKKKELVVVFRCAAGGTRHTSDWICQRC